MGIIIRPRANRRERGEMLEGQDGKTVGKHADDDGRDAVQQVGGITHNEGSGAAAEFGKINAPKNPMGTPKSVARRSSFPLPTMALAMPRRTRRRAWAAW